MPKPIPKAIRKEEVAEFANSVVNKVKFPMLATIENNQPRVRPVSPLRTEGFTVYIGNLRSYGKTAEIAANPKVELCYLDEDHNQVRITGVATVVSDRKLLGEIWQKNRLLQHYLGSLENPELIVYRIRPSRVRYMQEWALQYHEVSL